MGHEQRFNEATRGAVEADIERTIGTIRPFGATPTCEKCRLPLDEPGVPQKFMLCRGKNMLDTSNTPQCPFLGEHLHRQCPRCGWVFFEHTADHVADAETP